MAPTGAFYWGGELRKLSALLEWMSVSAMESAIEIEDEQMEECEDEL